MSSSIFSLAAKLRKAARPPPRLPLPTAHTHRCFSSKVKAKAKLKEKETALPLLSATPDMNSNAKPHRSQLVSYKVSSRLSNVLQASELTRSDAISRIFHYIKSNNLQNASDEIVCDEALKKAFGQAKVQRREVLKFLNVNLARLGP